jgi:hypothetical protein
MGVDSTLAKYDDFVPLIAKLKDDFRCVALGDDNIFGVSGVFENICLKRFVFEMLKLGYVYTASDKSSDIAFKSLDQCSFLKRGFYVTSKTVLAPLSMDTIREMPYWTTKSAPPDNDFEVLCTALYELSLHSRDVFDVWAPKFIEASKKYLGKMPPFVSYGACRAHIRSLEAYY